METVKVGQRYKSKVWLQPNTREAATMKITRVTKTAIYYRPDYGLHADGTEWLGSLATIDNTPEAINKWLEVTR